MTFPIPHTQGLFQKSALINDRGKIIAYCEECKPCEAFANVVRSQNSWGCLGEAAQPQKHFAIFTLTKLRNSISSI